MFMPTQAPTPNTIASTNAANPMPLAALQNSVHCFFAATAILDNVLEGGKVLLCEGAGFCKF
jgi:hypothetical protein